MTNTTIGAETLSPQGLRDYIKSLPFLGRASVDRRQLTAGEKSFRFRMFIDPSAGPNSPRLQEIAVGQGRRS
jgi:hypothetical protein